MIMSEEVKKEEGQKSEEEILNWWEAKTFTLEEVEQIKRDMQSSSEKWVQKLISWNKAYKTAMKELSNIAESPENLIELFSKDEEAGQIILDEYYDWIDIEAFKISIEYKVDITDPKIIEAKINEWVKRGLEAEKLALKTQKINDEKKQFIKDFDISWKELEEFENEFTDRMNLKSFSKLKIIDQLKKAYLDSTSDNDREELRKTLTIAKTMWTGAWKGWWDKKTQEDTNMFNQFFKKFNT